MMASAITFVHFSQIRRTGLSELPRGQRVSYALGPDRNGKAMAVNVELSDREQTEAQADAEARRKRKAPDSTATEKRQPTRRICGAGGVQPRLKV